ncbi:PREDICTED: putative late blight resistance protein homolog R1B-14 [Ipomoea nil]|uniref:putative late blight resistance protein homolog R1B-14 n=1 Tax=Ipomoea nil TaxID=35883 RepID=UPI000900E477|nr:PREDICTED: putative late blight resistance protein homolog R1B-14 [Ipomoea nil]
MACVGVNSLMRTIEIEFFQSRPRPILQEKKLISFNKQLIESLHEKLGSVLGELDDEKRIDGHLETQLRDVVFRVEDEIEQQVADLYVKRPQEDSDDVVPYLKLHHLLEQAIEDIDAIKEELEKVKMEGKQHLQQGRENKDEVFMKGNGNSSLPHSKDIMVGKNNDFHKVMEMLIQSSSEKELEVVSIEGMGGIGKTTLAKRVYDDPLVRSYFDRQAWAVSSQLHNKRQMLISLLDSMGIKEGDNDKLIEQGEDDKVSKLASQVQKAFKGQRYLVVMDDVWSGDAWDAIKGCFPNEDYGSRILLTTRHAEVVNYTCSKNKFSHQMELLDQSESWSLFCEKAGRSSCSVEFEMIAAPIVERCKGLPLAIAVVGGLFSRLDRLDEWKNIAESLNPLATTTVHEECSKILSLSYNYLPYNLKACFLYLGVFPEDHEINAYDLARLWCAEGLVKTLEDESFDVVAKRYIQELVDRNLILVSQQSCCTRKIKAFRVHDILHTFCVKEAQNENLLHVVHENGSNNNFPEKGFRWLSIQSSIDDFDMETCSKSCRSIFYFMEDNAAESLDFDHFNLLRIVYSTKHQLSKNPVHLVHLRYLSEAGEEDVNSSEQLRAWNIQTLHIRSDYGRNYLRFPQVHYLKCEKFSRGIKYHRLPKFVNQKLHSISWLTHYECTEGFFKRFPSLKAARIRGDTGECNGCIDKLIVDAPQLETLYIDSDRVQANPQKAPINDHIVLLKRLKKLTIRLMRFEWKGIRVLCKLPSLEVLKLKTFGCVGKKWKMEKDEKFCELIYLEIGRTNLVHWTAYSSNFPKLEHLRLSFCETLEEIPVKFEDIYTLKSIKLTNCHPSAVNSAQEIEEKKRNIGYDDMKVDVISLGPDEFASNEDALWTYMF